MRGGHGPTTSSETLIRVHSTWHASHAPPIKVLQLLLVYYSIHVHEQNSMHCKTTCIQSYILCVPLHYLYIVMLLTYMHVGELMCALREVCNNHVYMQYTCT